MPDTPADTLPSNPSSTRSRWHCLWLTLILIGAIGVRIYFINRPFHRDPEGCSAFYGVLARNYIRRPMSQTYGVPVMNMGRHNPPAFYSHHPPIVPVSIAAVYWVGGFRDTSTWLPPDWQTRLPTVIFTLCCVIALYVILRNRGAPVGGLVAAALFAFVPITAVYGGFADVISPQLLFFILLTIVAYERFWTAPNLRTLAITSLAFAPAMWTDWPALFLPVVLGVHFLFTRPPRRWPWMIAFGAICGVWFLLAYAQIWLVERDWTWIVEMVHKRSVAEVTDDRRPFTFAMWLAVAWRRMTHLHTLPVLIVGVVGILPLLIWPRWRTPAARPTLLVLSWAMLHILVGRQGVYQHEWWWWPLTPGLAMAAGLLLDQLYTRLYLRAGRHVACAFAAVLVLGILELGIYSTRAAHTELTQHIWIRPGDPTSHSIVDIGRAIHESTPPDSAAILVEQDLTLGLWYYADRPLIQYVWTVPDLLEHLNHPRTAVLPFGWTEQWTRRPVRVIFPKLYEPACPDLLAYLRAHFAEYPLSPQSAAKFYAFDLTRTASSEPVARAAR